MERISKNREERRNELVEAAGTLFLQKGYDNTAVSDIVRMLGVAQGTFYYHFQSKEEILAAVTDKIVSVTEKALKRIKNHTEIDAAKRMKMVIDAFREDIGRNKEIIRQVYSKSNSSLHQSLFKLALETYVPVLESIIEEGNKRGEFEVEHPLEMAEIIIVNMEFYCRKYVLTGDETRLQRILKTISLLLRPLLPSEGSTGRHLEII